MLKNRNLGSFLLKITDSYQQELEAKPEYEAAVEMSEQSMEELLESVPGQYIQLQKQVFTYESSKNFEQSILREFFFLKGVSIGIQVCKTLKTDFNNDIPDNMLKKILDIVWANRAVPAEAEV
jgi:hypothetical protein